MQKAATINCSSLLLCEASVILSVFVYSSVDDSNSRYVDNVTYGAFKVDEVDSLVQSHLNRADNLSVGAHSLHELV